MKFLAFAMLIGMSLSSLANAAIYESQSGTWTSSLCYNGGVTPDSVLEAVERDAIKDACHQAERKCLVNYGEKHPDRAFDCQKKEAYASDYSNHVWRAGGHQCNYTSQAMAYAVGLCIFEAI